MREGWTAQERLRQDSKLPGDPTCTSTTSASLADLMARIGHSSRAIALRYQHAVEGRDQKIAAALSGFAEGDVIARNARSITG